MQELSNISLTVENDSIASKLTAYLGKYGHTPESLANEYFSFKLTR